MPGRNGTGPMGKGPSTGRGVGECRGDEEATGRRGVGRGQGGMGRGMGRGLGRGRGRGRGFGGPYVDSPEGADSDLEKKTDKLESELEDLKKRMDA